MKKTCLGAGLAALVVLGLASLGGAMAAPAVTESSSDVLAANMDRSVDPGVDFFEFANGGWLARHPIPADESSWGIGNLVQEEIYAKLGKINEEAAAAGAPAGSDQRKIGDFWATAMDETKADALGLEPLKEQLAAIDAIKTVADAINVSFGLRRIGIDAFCVVSIEQDEKQSDVMSVHVSQGGLGLPDRDYYFNREKGVARVRREYLAHIERTMRLLGQTGEASRRAAKRVMKFETALAKASRKLEDLRDPEKNYNKMSPADLTGKRTPLFAWDQKLAEYSLRPGYFVVGQPEFFGAMNRVLKRTPPPVLRDYLRFHLVSAYAASLGKQFDDEQFSFNGKILSGRTEERPRWKRALDAEEGAMGMVLGKQFARDFFPERTRKRYSDLVAAIRTAYAARIDRVEWMSDATKAKAREKLARMTAKVGYPDKWKDCSALVVGTNSYCENLMNAARWRFNDMVAKLGKPVDREEWHMTPQTYDAYYEPANNEIVLPAAAFLVPGRSDDELDDAVVYGYAAASTIGHEITHGFDDEGRQFDAAGNLRDWWTPQDAKRFKERSDVMVAEFNAYEPIRGLHINGRATLGENLADYGGVLLGLEAFKKTGQYREGKPIAGLTPLQRFFLGYALGWQFSIREESLRKSLLSNVHAPAKWRVLGPLSNVPEFHQAFGVKAGQPMWRSPESCVKVW